jgi:hypothetical protein
MNPTSGKARAAAKELAPVKTPISRTFLNQNMYNWLKNRL